MHQRSNRHPLDHRNPDGHIEKGSASLLLPHPQGGISSKPRSCFSLWEKGEQEDSRKHTSSMWTLVVLSTGDSCRPHRGSGQLRELVGVHPAALSPEKQLTLCPVPCNPCGYCTPPSLNLNHCWSVSGSGAVSHSTLSSLRLCCHRTTITCWLTIPKLSCCYTLPQGPSWCGDALPAPPSHYCASPLRA